MTEAAVSFAGNLTDHPELRHTEGGIARATFRVAVSGRREQEASFFTVVVWGDQGDAQPELVTSGRGCKFVGGHAAIRSSNRWRSVRSKRRSKGGRRRCNASRML
jgi:single-stranded DNA-binding protein